MQNKQQAIEYLVPTAKGKMRAAKSDLTKKTENGGKLSIDSYVGGISHFELGFWTIPTLI